MAIYSVRSYPYKLNLSKEPCWIRFQYGYSPLPSETRIVLNVNVKWSPTDDLLGYKTFTFEAFGDASGTVSFNLTPFIDEYLGNRFDLPHPPGAFSLWWSFFSYLSVNIDVQEYADGVLLSSYNLRTAIPGFVGDFYFYNGGLTIENRPTANYFGWKNAKSPLLPFHTWHKKRITRKRQPQYLTYSRQDGSLYLAEVRIQYYGHSPGGTFSTSSYVTPSPGTEYIPTHIDVGYYYPGDPVDYYTVQLFDMITEDPISERVTYYMDYKYYNDIKYILYQNGIGGWETFCFKGNTIIKTDTQRSSSLMAASPTQTADGLRKTHFLAETEIIRFNTQYMLDTEQLQLREIMLSPRIYLIQGAQFLPIEPTENAKDWVDTGKFMQSGYLEFRKCYRNEVYMPPNCYT